MGVSRNDNKWMEMFHLLEAFVEREGRLPGRFEVYQGVNLGNWVANQRSIYKKGLLSDYRKGLLERVGVAFIAEMQSEVNKKQWFAHFESLYDYFLEYGSFPAKGVEYKGFRIGSWLNTQKVKFRKGQLSKDRAALLQKIGIDLDADFREERWFFHFSLLKDYFQETGGPPRFDVVYQGVNLGAWFCKQKYFYRNGSLPDSRRVLLESAGVDFEIDIFKVRQDRWNEKLDLLKEYIDVYGDFPSVHAEHKGVAIGLWFRDKIYAYRNGELPEYRWESLCEIADQYGLDLFIDSHENLVGRGKAPCLYDLVRSAERSSVAKGSEVLKDLRTCNDMLDER